MKKVMKAVAALMLMTAVTFAIGCTKPDDPNNGGDNNGGVNDSLTVKVTTYTPEQVAQFSAVCGGEVTGWDEGIEIEELGICWSKNSNPKVTDAHLSTLNWQEPFICVLTDLELDTKYYVRAFAKVGTDFYYGEEKSFTTLPVLNGTSAPSVFTLFVTDIHSNYAVGYGYVAGNGGLEVTERGFCWSSSTSNPTIANSHIANGSDLGQYSVAMTALMPNTTYYARAYAINSKGVSYGIVFCFETNDDGGYPDPDWVDLGLPSGLLWATKNVGASSPEDYGDYFAWGETQTKSFYSYDNYKFYKAGTVRLTKYCTKSSYGYNGFTDNLTILEPDDDAATANWGSGWRMPTKDEWQELYDNTTRTWTTQNGINGMLFTASGGGSLFLPAAGYIDYSGELLSAGDYGNYWSSSLYTDTPDHAWFLDFIWVGIEDVGEYGLRKIGQSVRPVRAN